MKELFSLEKFADSDYSTLQQYYQNNDSIQFNLNSSELSSVEIRIHDQVGKEIQRIPVKSAKEGSNTVELNMQGLPSGIYYYSLIVNGNQTDAKKMMVL
jgi:hypothetical protein